MDPSIGIGLESLHSPVGQPADAPRPPREEARAKFKPDLSASESAVSPGAVVTFEVKLLRRQIDALLFEQAARTMTGKPPPLTSDELINSLLSRQNAARKQLDDAIAANGIDEANIVAFLQRAGDIDAYIQAEVMKDLSQEERKDAAKRDALVRAWLDKAWTQQNVQIYFYDPDTVLPADERGGAAP
mgnify:CR=1 FL=1